MRHRYKGALFGVLLSLTSALACPTPTAPDLDLAGDFYPRTEPYHEISPPAWYIEQYNATRLCVSQFQPLTGHTADQIRWFIVDAETVLMPGGVNASAYYSKSKIFITHENADDPWIVAHEAVHASGYVWDHPPAIFKPCVEDRFPQDFPQRQPSDGTATRP